MLVLARKVDEEIVIDNGRIRISVLGVSGSRVRLGVVAAPEIPVYRSETRDPQAAAVQQDRTPAVAAAT
jgi:carbon storage regulator CsrA